MKSQQKQVTFITNLTFTLFVVIVCIQSIYYQSTKFNYPLTITTNYHRYLILWAILFTVAIISLVITMIIKKIYHLRILIVQAYVAITIPLIPFLIPQFEYLTMIIFIIFTILCALISKIFKKE